MCILPYYTEFGKKNGFFFLRQSDLQITHTLGLQGVGVIFCILDGNERCWEY